MRSLILLGAVALSSLASALQLTPIVGNYQFVPDAEVKAYCKKNKLPVPKGELVLRDDNTFSLAVNDRDGVQKTMGTYAVENDLVRFTVDEGIGRDLPHVMRLTARGLNGKGAAFSRVVVKNGVVVAVVPKVADAIQPAVKVGALTPPVVTPPSTPVEGLWTAYRNGQEDKSIRITFFPNGRFKFTGLGVSSGGEFKFDVETSQITLTYLEVDGQKLADGVHMEKTITLEVGEEGAAFTIEKCVYRRGSK